MLHATPESQTDAESGREAAGRHGRLQLRSRSDPWQQTWMLFGDVVSRLFNGPYGASYGFL